eukprot:4209094-Pyramimonas_sp.AAC.1
MAAASADKPKECSVLGPHQARAAKLSAGLGFPIFFVSACMVDSAGVAGDSVGLLQALQSWVGSLEWPWVILADWNIEPDGLASWAKQPSGVLARPWSPTRGKTRGKRECGYAIVSGALASRVGAVKVLSDAPISPRSPTAIELKGLRQRATVTRA